MSERQHPHNPFPDLSLKSLFRAIWQTISKSSKFCTFFDNFTLFFYKHNIILAFLVDRSCNDITFPEKFGKVLKIENANKFSQISSANLSAFSILYFTL